MKYWTLTEADIDRIALGAGILGTGGGADRYLGMLMVKAQLREGMVVRVIRPCDLAPDAFMLALGNTGAPTVGIEKMEEGDEGVRSLHALEQYTGRKVDAVIADEIGGSNSLAPMITAVKLGLPVIDADGKGRAFPEVRMTTFFIHGQASQPAVLADALGNVMIVMQATSSEMLEKLMRAGTVAMGCTAPMTTAPMSGDFIRRYGVPHTVSQTWTLEDTVLDAHAAKTHPVEMPIARAGGTLLMRGKVSDVGRRARDCGGICAWQSDADRLGCFREPSDGDRDPERIPDRNRRRPGSGHGPRSDLHSRQRNWSPDHDGGTALWPAGQRHRHSGTCAVKVRHRTALGRSVRPPLAMISILPTIWVRRAMRKPSPLMKLERKSHETP